MKNKKLEIKSIINQIYAISKDIEKETINSKKNTILNKIWNDNDVIQGIILRYLEDNK